jgi:isopropylmalate/homocitrate/citramalate synthase
MSQSSRKMNQGLALYKQSQREETLHRIDDAIKYLRDKGLEITKKNIASELGMHYNALKKTYITYHLMRYSEFNPEIQAPKTVTNEELEKEAACLRNNLKKAKLTIKNKSAEITKLGLKNKELADKYQRLLGRYQIDTGKKIIPF